MAKTEPTEPPVVSGMWERFNHNAYPFHANRFIHTYATRGEHKFHFHDFAQIFYLKSGKYRHRIADTEYEGLPGSLMIIPPGVPHDYYLDDDDFGEFIMISIMPSFFPYPMSQKQLTAFTHLFLPEFSQELGFEPFRYILLKEDEKQVAEEVFTKLASYNWLRTVNNIDALRNELCDIFSKGIFYLSADVLKKSATFIEHKFLPIIKTIYYMNINYNKIIHREELISMSNICQTDYFRYIKRILGCTYSNYMQMIRVRRAIQMCSFSPYSLSYIADICGFGDLAYMEKRIKKFHPTSISPREIKKRRNQYIKSFPFAIKSRSEYENISKNFYAYGL